MNFYEQIFSRGRVTGEGMTHFERLFAAKFGGSPPPEVREYTGAVPVTITADGTPLLDYRISGNTTQNGTPTPDNPIMPQGTGERTENLWNEDYTGISGSIKYVSVYVGNGSFTLSTSCPAIDGAAALFFLTGNVQSGASTVSNGVYKNRPITVTSTDGYVTVAYRYVSYSTGSADPWNEKTMLNSGSTALPYEPYGYKIPISSASTTTPVYLGEVETERKIKKLVLTGQETGWQDAEASGGRNRFVLSVSDAIAADTSNPYSICSHLPLGASGATYSRDNVYTIASGKLYMRLTIDYDTLITFKTYLQQQYAAGTPVTVWYVLANPETAVVNEPLMRIGDYADTLSKAQALVSIPTNNGSTTVDVDTTVKPSEVYIKYMG